jgi:hypothetical protein
MNKTEQNRTKVHGGGGGGGGGWAYVFEGLLGLLRAEFGEKEVRHPRHALDRPLHSSEGLAQHPALACVRAPCEGGVCGVWRACPRVRRR